MNKLVIALAVSLAAITGASAGALDAYQSSSYQAGPAVDFTATASTGVANPYESRDRLGDGSPMVN